MIRILFTGAGRRVELIQAFRNAALLLNQELKIYGADMSGTAPALAYCDYTRRITAMKDPKYIDDLLQICLEDKIDLIVPTIDTDLLILSENKCRFNRIGTRVLISEPDKIQICRDKNLTFAFFENLGLHAPRPVKDWKKYNSGYPAFIKPKDGSSSINAFKVENVEELEIYARQIDDYIVQPFIYGHEYTIDIFCNWSGEPISIVPRERIQVRAGEVLQTRIELDQTMIEESRKLCAAFRPCGPMTVQLIRDGNGVDWFIEINPRFGGGAPLSMKAGARSAEMILRMMDGESVDYITDIADGAVYSRFDQSVCIRESKSDIKGIIFDLDDTLYSEKEYVRSGFKAVSDYLGGGFENTLWSYFEAGKQPVDELLKDLNREMDKEKVMIAYRNHKPDIRLYAGVEDLLRMIRSIGLKIGIITDGRPEGQRQKLCALGLEPLVDDIIVTDELGGMQFRKPCDIAFRIMRTKWKLNPEQMVYVGDNPAKDFQAPKQLGMKGIWFRNTEGIYTNTGTFEPSIARITDVQDYVRKALFE